MDDLLEILTTFYEFLLLNEFEFLSFDRSSDLVNAISESSILGVNSF